MLQRIAWLCGFLLVALLPARADIIPGTGFSSGNWDGSAYDDNGAFSHCAITAKYKSGISLHFAVDRQYLWRMGFSHPDWNMRKGDVVQIRYQIDRNAPVPLSATVVYKDFLIAELPATDKVFNQFRHGNTLNMEAGAQFYTFSLLGTSKALAKVLKCVQLNINYRAPSVAQPAPAPSQPPPSQPPPSQPAPAPAQTASEPESDEAPASVPPSASHTPPSGNTVPQSNQGSSGTMTPQDMVGKTKFQ